MIELLFRDDPYLQRCPARVIASGDNAVRLDRTVFYPMGGGQPGDTGRLRLDSRTVVEVIDTQKGDAPDDVVHIVADGGALLPGMTLEAEIDWDRRHRLMRMHTLLHLVCAVMKDAQLTGAQIGDGKGRVDFHLPEAPDKEVLAEALNRLVREDHAVRPLWITDSDFAAQPELIRTMSVKPPTGFGRVQLLEIEGVDLQPCGGTHVRSTAEIGAVTVTKIENKGKLNRRIAVALG
ncbi:MAG TPA: alanyl-tRNA editing protein [Dongiaceae bacterium]|jgi:misacylated tRNA(Ala) deacylase|nr:alanyl-tRNA editing protein [Dongiaceae bacterium]